MSTLAGSSRSDSALPNRIRWSQTAHEDFQAILSWIEKNNPNAAERVGRTILDLIDRMTELAHRGRRGAVEGTLEKVVAGLPYIVVFRIHEGRAEAVDHRIVEIVNIRHGARRWPPEGTP